MICKTKEIVSKGNEITSLKAQIVELNHKVMRGQSESKSDIENACKNKIDKLNNELNTAKSQIEILSNEKEVLLHKLDDFSKISNEKLNDIKDQNEVLITKLESKNKEYENINKLKKENDNLSKIRNETKTLKQEMIKLKEMIRLQKLKMK